METKQLELLKKEYYKVYDRMQFLQKELNNVQASLETYSIKNMSLSETVVSQKNKLTKLNQLSDKYNDLYDEKTELSKVVEEVQLQNDKLERAITNISKEVQRIEQPKNDVTFITPEHLSKELDKIQSK
ncbi:MAG: hypothetical protein ACK5HS_00070 [Mycoplasmatales bacterium]